MNYLQTGETVYSKSALGLLKDSSHSELQEDLIKHMEVKRYVSDVFSY